MKLTVSACIAPHPEQISSEKLNELFTGELAEFEAHFMRQQQKNSPLTPSPLLTGERSLIRAYLFYAYTTSEERRKAEVEVHA